ncbi:MAG: NAD(P)-dependent oxidoreductase [Bacillota bacterium]|jgi:3-hydroxyisobutyrate dehydrogenase|nr:NAD(P)-dependent oxidoreductase [Bacillota bacterium]
MNVGFIGLGIMGKAMATNLIKAGFPVTVYNRTKSKMDALVAMGAKPAGSPKEVAGQSDVIITMVSDTPDVEQVILGENGVIHGVKSGSIVIDMSTISATATRKIAEELAAKGVEMLDAPVSGGDKGAVAGTLSIMVGGSEKALERVTPVFNAMGKKITHMGPVGNGQVTKMCNQIACALTILSFAEAFVLAAAAGLDVDKVLEAISGGAAGSWSMSNYGPRVLKGDFAPGFMVKLHQKDMRLVMNFAREMGVALPGAAIAQQLLSVAEKEEDGRLGNQSMIKPLEAMAGVKARSAK